MGMAAGSEPELLKVLAVILVWPLLGLALCYGIGDDDKGAAMGVKDPALGGVRSSRLVPFTSTNFHFVRDGAIVGKNTLRCVAQYS